MNLSKLELEVLQYICDAGTTTAPEVHSKIAEKRQTTYSTIKTIFDRLENKGAIYRKSRVGRTSIYAAKVTEENVQKSLLKEFVTKVFRKDKTPLFNMLIRDSSLTDDEVIYLIQLLKSKHK